MAQQEEDDDDNIILYIKRQIEYADKLWHDMGHDITRLSPQLQEELANFRRLLLAPNSTLDGGQKSIMKCMEIGVECDGLPSHFVIGRLYDIYCMMSKDENKWSNFV